MIFISNKFWINEAENAVSMLESVEIREYEGQKLSSIDDSRENSIKGPQFIDNESYRLVIAGLVDNEIQYTYNRVVNDHQLFQKVVTLHCVEG